MKTDPIQFSNLTLRMKVFDYAISGSLTESQEEVVGRKSAALNAVYYASELHMLVFNGGLVYYFDVHGLRTAMSTVDALSFLGATQHLTLFSRALTLLQGDTPLNAWNPNSLAHRWTSDLEIVGESFAMTKPELGDVISDYIRSHLDSFREAFET